MSSTESGPCYFWHEYDEPYGFMSQWFESPVEHEGVRFKTAEQWMMYQKAKLFEDHEIAEKILKASTPRQQKGLGRKVKGYSDKKWDAHKLQIVEDGNWLKFTKSTYSDDLARKLLETGDRELIEASPFDRAWGIGYRAEDAKANREHWGENLLGKAIMRVRERLRAEKENEREGKGAKV